MTERRKILVSTIGAAGFALGLLSKKAKASVLGEENITLTAISGQVASIVTAITNVTDKYLEVMNKNIKSINSYIEKIQDTNQTLEKIKTFQKAIKDDKNLFQNFAKSFIQNENDLNKIKLKRVPKSLKTLKMLKNYANFYDLEASDISETIIRLKKQNKGEDHQKWHTKEDVLKVTSHASLSTAQSDLFLTSYREKMKDNRKNVLNFGLTGESKKNGLEILQASDQSQILAQILKELITSNELLKAHLEFDAFGKVSPKQKEMAKKEDFKVAANNAESGNYG